MTTITEYLAEQKRLAEAATEGQWEADQTEPGIWCPKRIVIGNYTAADMFESPAWEDGTPEDLAFIAAARESVPRLVAALEAVREVLAPHVEYQLRRAAKLGRRASDCVCEQCRAWAAIEAALGGESE